ncbi:MAG: hypothetical protein QOC95_40 [Thermoleophilaceae bacterium]|nr:hypothetical protein [Thermoleophilaceae bacterium]
MLKRAVVATVAVAVAGVGGEFARPYARPPR